MEQNFSTLTARLSRVETFAASASNISWPSIEYVDGSTAAKSHGPTSSAPKMNNPVEPVYHDSVALANNHKKIIKWIDNLWDESNKPTCNKPVRICKPNSVSIDSFLEHEANVRTLLLDKRMMVERIGLTNFKFSFLMEMTKVHTSSQHSILAHMSSTLKIRRNGKNGFQTCSASKRTNIYPCCT